jgi:hypothetical protein
MGKEDLEFMAFPTFTSMKIAPSFKKSTSIPTAAEVWGIPVNTM